MNFLDHPNFKDVRLRVIGPIYGGTKYYRIKVEWWLRRESSPWMHETLCVEKKSWDRFLKGTGNGY